MALGPQADAFDPSSRDLCVTYGDRGGRRTGLDHVRPEAVGEMAMVVVRVPGRAAVEKADTAADAKERMSLDIRSHAPVGPTSESL